MTKDEALALALHALHTKGEHHPRVYESIYAIQTVLAQPPLLEQEPTPWRDMVVATLVREGINKHKARELADHFAAQPVQEFVEHTVIAGALFDFMGWLTSRKERLVLSSADEASPAADAINDFAKMRGLSLGDAQVLDWQDYTAPPAAQRPWVGLTDDDWDKVGDMPDTFDQGAAWAAARLKELNK